MKRGPVALCVSAILHAGVLALPGVSVRMPEPVEETPAVTLSLRPPPPPVPIVEEIAEPAGRPEPPSPPPPRPPPPPSPPEPPPPSPPEEVPPPVVEEAVVEPPPVPAPAAAEVPSPPIAGPEPGDDAPGDPVPPSTLGEGGEGSGAESGRGHGRRGTKRRAESEVLPRPVFAPKPPYPSRSRDRGEEGTVILVVLVSADGRVEECRVDRSSGHPLLDGSALATVRDKWRFKPGTVGGEPSARWVRVPVEFGIRRR